MRKLSLIAAAMLVGSVLAIGAADAQQPRRGAAAMEGPAHPCRTVAMAFDQALRDRIGPAVGNGGQFPGPPRCATRAWKPATPAGSRRVAR